MNIKEKLSDQINRMDRIIDWVKVCDDKTSILLSVALLIPSITIGTDWVLGKIQGVLSLLISACQNSGEGYVFSIPNCLSLTFLVASLLFFVLSMIRFIKVLRAKIKENSYGNDVVNDSLIHFNNLAKIGSFKEYKQKAEEETDEAYYEDLLSQTYINAKRCAEKFAEYNAGMRHLCCAVAFLILFIISLFFVSI